MLYTATTVRVKPERNEKFCYHILSFLVFVFKSNKSIIIYYDYLEAFRFYSDTLRDIWTEKHLLMIFKSSQISSLLAGL